ncbi:DNA-binding domain-containing protein [Parabacteroides distasonis]|uniref:DNA-binding domain-containing protein n=1 Tax=Parabacteroides distasonis TaxID=823 RepID=UPI002FEE0420
MDKEIPKSELPKPFRKQSIRVSKSHLPGNTSYKGSVVWQRTLSIDDIAARVVDKRSEYRKETLVNSGQRLCFVPGFAFRAGEWEAIVCTQFTPTYHLYKEPRYGTLTFTVM